MVHIVNKSPFKFRSLDSCLQVADAEDPILLIEDGVYAAMEGTAASHVITEALKTHPVFAIQADLKARGLDKVLNGVQTCDYAGFVTLVEEHLPCSWL